ncbi:MAG TPA: SCO family protein [Steroidobacteraceae bacterium]|nr:SCO family protein [Steroidobacteraceae bacterium]
MTSAPPALQPPPTCTLRRLLALTAIALALTACSPAQAPFALENVTGLLPQLKFSLTDQDNRPVSAHDYRGKVVLLYFGYTHCPDACPTTLAMLAQSLRNLGPAATKTRVLFVSVDPARDTPEVLKRYVGFFGPQFVGLRGAGDALTALTKRYRVAFHLEPPDRNGYYAVDHSSAVFVFDVNGRARLLGQETDGAAKFTQDLRRLTAG